MLNIGQLKWNFKEEVLATTMELLWLMKKMELTFIDDEDKWVDLESLLRLSKNKISNLKMQLKEILNSYFVIIPVSSLV